MDYKKKYLKYKAKYLNEVNNKNVLMNKNELMLNLNKYANLDYESKYMMFGGGGGELINELNGYAPILDLETLITQTYLHCNPLMQNIFKDIYYNPEHKFDFKLLTDVDTNIKKITSEFGESCSNKAASLKEEIYIFFQNKSHALLITDIKNIFNEKSVLANEFISALKTKIGKINAICDEYAKQFDNADVATIIAISFKDLFIYLHAKAEDALVKPITRYIDDINGMMDRMKILREKLSIMKDKTYESNEYKELEEFLYSFKTVVSGLKKAIRNFNIATISTGLITAAIPGAQAGAIICIAIFAITELIEQIVKAVHLTIKAAWFSTLSTKDKFNEAKKNLDDILNNNIITKIFPMPDIYTKMSDYIKEIVETKYQMLESSVKGKSDEAIQSFNKQIQDNKDKLENKKKEFDAKINNEFNDTELPLPQPMLQKSENLVNKTSETFEDIRKYFNTSHQVSSTT